MEYEATLSESEVMDLFETRDPMKMVVAIRKASNFDTTFAERMLELLDHEYYEIRAYSCKSLGRVQYQKAIPLIVKLLKDEVEEVRFSAAEALRYFTSDQVIQPLLISLADHSRETRRQSTFALKQQDRDILYTQIQEWIDQIDEDDYEMNSEDAILKIDVTRGIMEACSEFHYPWVNSILEQGLNSPDLETIRLAAISVGNRRERKFEARLLELQDVEDDDLRLSVIYALSRIEFENKLETLIPHVDDTYEFVREILAGYLPKMYFNDKILETIAQYINDPVPFVRSALASALDKSIYLKFLRQLIKDSNPYVREEAIEALKRIGGGEVLKILKNHEEDDDLVEISLQNAIADISSMNGN